MRVYTGGEHAGAIETALANHDGPTLIDCLIDRDDCTSDLISFRPLLLGSPRRNRELPSAAPTIALRHALDLVAPRFTLSER